MKVAVSRFSGTVAPVMVKMFTQELPLLEIAQPVWKTIGAPVDGVLTVIE